MLPDSPIAGASPATASMRGTIRDLAPAVRYAASYSEMAVLDEDRQGHDEHVFTLISVRDEEAVLRVRVPQAPPDPAQEAREARRRDRAERPAFPERGRFRAFVGDFRPDLSIPGADLSLEMDAQMTIGPGSARREREFLTLLARRLRELDEGVGIAKP